MWSNGATVLVDERSFRATLSLFQGFCCFSCFSCSPVSRHFYRDEWYFFGQSSRGWMGSAERRSSKRDLRSENFTRSTIHQGPAGWRPTRAKFIKRLLLLRLQHAVAGCPEVREEPCPSFAEVKPVLPSSINLFGVTQHTFLNNTSTSVTNMTWEKNTVWYYLWLKVGFGEGLHSVTSKQFSCPCARELWPPWLAAGWGGPAPPGLPGDWGDKICLEPCICIVTIKHVQVPWHPRPGADDNCWKPWGRRRWRMPGSYSSSVILQGVRELLHPWLELVLWYPVNER